MRRSILAGFVVTLAVLIGNAAFAVLNTRGLGWTGTRAADARSRGGPGGRPRDAAVVRPGHRVRADRPDVGIRRRPPRLPPPRAVRPGGPRPAGATPHHPGVDRGRGDRLRRGRAGDVPEP